MSVFQKALKNYQNLQGIAKTPNHAAEKGKNHKEPTKTPMDPRSVQAGKPAGVDGSAEEPSTIGRGPGGTAHPQGLAATSAHSPTEFGAESRRGSRGLGWLGLGGSDTERQVPSAEACTGDRLNLEQTRTLWDADTGGAGERPRAGVRAAGSQEDQGCRRGGSSGPRPKALS